MAKRRRPAAIAPGAHRRMEAGPYMLQLSGSAVPLAICTTGWRGDETFPFIAHLHAPICVSSTHDPKGGCNMEKNRKWPTNGQLAQCVKEFIDGYDKNFIECATKGYVPYIRDYMAIPQNDEILLYYDAYRSTARFTSGEYGFLLCTSGIIERSFVESRHFVSWTAFATGQLLPLEESEVSSKSRLKLRDSLGMIRTLIVVGNHPAAVQIRQFFRELQLFMRARFGLEEVMAPARPAGASGATNEQLALSAKGFIANYDQTLIKKIACGKAKKLAKHLEVPAGEEIFLHHGGETAGDEKNGFAVTAGGFYCRAESRPIGTDWQTFFMGTLETGMDKAKRYVVCCRDSSGADGTPIVRFQWTCANTTAADACILIIHLQDYLRKRYA